MLRVLQVRMRIVDFMGARAFGDVAKLKGPKALMLCEDCALPLLVTFNYITMLPVESYLEISRLSFSNIRITNLYLYAQSQLSSPL